MSGNNQTAIQGQHLREFLYFYLFFSPSAFATRLQRPPLVHRAKQGSSEYALGVSEDLKERVFDALRLCISGFLSKKENALSVEDLELCRTNSFVFLYRLLFVMYAEDRGLLPYRINITYTQNRSLARLRDEVAHGLDRKGPASYNVDHTDLWKDLANLFDLVDAGHARYGVPAYNGGLFSSEQHPFLVEKAIGDRDLSQIIDKLSRSIDPQNRDAGFFRVDYRDLAIRQLGSVYEGLLEMQPRYTAQPLGIIKSTKAGTFVERFHPLSQSVPQGFRDTGQRVSAGAIYLETDKGERRSTGSYYTPDHIVDHIVENTLGPLCARIQSELRREIEATEGELSQATQAEREVCKARIESLHGEFDDRVMQLKVLDPSMGSGHFLVRACQYLAEEIATSPFTSDADADRAEDDSSTLVFWKRRVAEHCLFGVDLNPLAVELAKLALWLETVSKDQPLAFLDHHLRCGNSLVGTKLAQLDCLPDAPRLFAGLLNKEFSQRKEAMLQPLHELRVIQSKDAVSVKAKERLLRLYETRANAFVALGDIWCGEFFRAEGQLSNEEYSELVRNLGTPKRLKQLLETHTELLAAAKTGASPFHWELEFPEAFFDAPEGRSQGFDAIIGNPPYDVLASKELETDMSPLKRFLQAQQEYSGSFVGKNNLYKLFICKAVDLLREEGLLSFIVPMALLGDEYAIGIRKLILASGTFTEIHSFPQKDDPRNRVFPEAKLSTVVFGMLKTSDETRRKERFRATRHPGREFLKEAPTLLVATAEIPEYDPSNMTIVSCSQQDWDLAVRLMSQKHFCRLGERCVSFQGEVNETTNKKFLSKDPSDGPEVLRGASVCLYAVREASQGESLFINREAFLQKSAKGSKAWHSQQRRVGFQRSAPQNNFRRIIAAPVEKDEFCFDTVSYIPEGTSKLPAEVLLALLNSKLLDWYFLLGSSNSKLNEYQFNNLPCPLFTADPIKDEQKILKALETALEIEDAENIWAVVADHHLCRPPFSRSLQALLVMVVHRILEVETNRGTVSKAARAKLAEGAQPYQDLIDRILFTLAGFSPEEVLGIEERLEGLV